MEDSTRQVDRSGWDSIHSDIPSYLVARGAPAVARSSTRRTRTPAESRNRLIAWLIMDGILLVTIAYGYRVLLAERTIETTTPFAAIARSMTTGSAAYSAPPRTAQFPGSPPFEIGPHVERQPLRGEPDRYSAAAAKTLGYECIGSVAYTKRIVNGVWVVANDPTIRCE